MLLCHQMVESLVSFDYGVFPGSPRLTQTTRLLNFDLCLPNFGQTLRSNRDQILNFSFTVISTDTSTKNLGETKFSHLKRNKRNSHGTQLQAQQKCWNYGSRSAHIQRKERPWPRDCQRKVGQGDCLPLLCCIPYEELRLSYRSSNEHLAGKAACLINFYHQYYGLTGILIFCDRCRLAAGCSGKLL